MHDVTMKEGYVFLVGAGPGDPELITVKGIKILEKCDVVVYDRLISMELLKYVSNNCKKIDVGKSVGKHTVRQEEINQILVEEARQGHIVVRLKGGDPFVFGRGGEEAIALQKENIGYEVIPGVTSAVAVPEMAGIPVTHRGISRSFHVITGQTKDNNFLTEEQLRPLAEVEGTLVFLMAVQQIEYIVDALIRYGKAATTEVAVISNGGTRKEQMVKGNLNTIVLKMREAKITPPAVIVVGSVAKLELRKKEGDWKKNEMPLQQLKIGVTGTENFTRKLTQQLEEEGAECVQLNYVNLRVKLSKKEFRKVFEELSEYQWLVFTSSNAVRYWMEAWKEYSTRTIETERWKFAAIGCGTLQTLKEYGVEVSFVPSKFTTQALAIGLCDIVEKGEKVFFPRAESGSKVILDRLRESQIEVREVKLYETEMNIQLRDEVLGKIKSLDYITFASADGVRGFFKGLNEERFPFLTHVQFACIGEVTEKALLELGKNNAIVGKEYSGKGLVEAIIESRKGEANNKD